MFLNLAGEHIQFHLSRDTCSRFMTRFYFFMRGENWVNEKKNHRPRVTSSLDGLKTISLHTFAEMGCKDVSLTVR